MNIQCVDEYEKSSDFLKRITPIIVTLHDKNLTEYDIKKYIEHGLTVVRFRMPEMEKEDIIQLLELLKQAMHFFCEKYNLKSWPIGLCINVTDARIRTGFIAENIPEPVLLKANTLVEITSDWQYCAKCDSNRVYVDDPYTLPTIPLGTEISINFGKIVMYCTEHLDEKTIKCKVSKEGLLSCQDIVLLRDVKLKEPPLIKDNLDILEFGKEYKFNMVIVQSIRSPTILKKVKSVFKDHEVPLIISEICEQEGLDNIDDIIKDSDGIIFAREYLSSTIKDVDRIHMMQLLISAKCRSRGKPFIISGHLLEGTIQNDMLTYSDLNDITNAFLQGSGFMLRDYINASHTAEVLRYLNDICINVEPPQPMNKLHEFWRLSKEYVIPLNAAEACIQASIVTAKAMDASVIIVPTFTGKTAKQLSHVVSERLFIVAVTTNAMVAGQLLLYRGVISIIYDRPAGSDWITEMNARVQFAIDYCEKIQILRYGEPYVTLKKSSMTSCYADHICGWQLVSSD